MKIKIPAIIQDYAPRWTKKMLKNRTWDKIHDYEEVENKTLSMAQYDRCIVGEVNGFDGSYAWAGGKTRRCRTCEHFADEIDGYIIRGNKKELEDQLKAFSQHTVEKHKKEMDKVNNG